MKPPIVNELTSPRAQSTRRIRAIVQSMLASYGRASTTVVPTGDPHDCRAISEAVGTPPALPTPDFSLPRFRLGNARLALDRLLAARTQHGTAAASGKPAR